MGKQYFCDYCNKSFADNLTDRKKHISSSIHIKLKKLHYDSFRDPRVILAEELSKNPCHAYMASGACKFGETCHYSHLDTQRRQQLQMRIDEENHRKVKHEAPKDEFVPTLENWLSKVTPKTEKLDTDGVSSIGSISSIAIGSSENNQNIMRTDSSTVLTDPHTITEPVYEIAPCLVGLNNIPPSLLPIPPGACDNLTPLEWGVM